MTTSRAVGRARRTGLLVKLLALIAVVVSICYLAPAQPVLAHADLARAEPAPNSVLDEPPARVTIWFTEPLEPAFSTIRVLDAQGQQVDRGDSVVDRTDPTAMTVSLGPLPNGTYTVAWSNVSTVDGHRVRGSFVFSVGEPISEAAPGEQLQQPLLQSPVDPVFRWLGLLGALAIVGGLGFELLVVRPALLGSRAGQSLRQVGERLAARSRKLLWVAIGVLLLASLGQLVVQTGVVYDIPLGQALGGPIIAFVTGTDWGSLWLWRVGLLVVVAGTLGLGLVVSSRGQGRQWSGPALPEWSSALALAVGAGMLLTWTLTGHGAAVPQIRFGAIFSDYLHLLAASFWVGGLFHLALALPLVLGALTAEERRRALSGLGVRFSTLATLSVGTLVISGVYSGWAQVTIPQAIATPYGWTLVAKLALAVPLLALGAVNLLWVKPRLAKEQRAGHWFRWLVAGEAGLAVLVLLSVGVLTSLEPARQVAAREGIGQAERLLFTDSAEGADIILEIEPGRVGPNRFTVSLQDRLGRPITNATAVVLGLNYLGADLGASTVPLASAGAGEYVLDGGLVSIAGLWQVELVVRRPDAFDARTAFRFEAAPAGGEAIAPSADTGRLLLGAELALIGFLFLFVGLPLGGWRTRRGAVVMGSGLASAFVGIVLTFNTLAGQTAADLRNPFPPTPGSLEAGQEAYAQNCQACHGVGGRGDGPLAADLRPTLRDPTAMDLAVHVPLHTEGELFQIVRDGIPNTPMASFRDTLTEEEIWHVINYIETFEE